MRSLSSYDGSEGEIQQHITPPPPQPNLDYQIQEVSMLSLFRNQKFFAMASGYKFFGGKYLLSKKIKQCIKKNE